MRCLVSGSIILFTDYDYVQAILDTYKSGLWRSASTSHQIWGTFPSARSEPSGLSLSTSASPVYTATPKSGFSLTKTKLYVCSAGSPAVPHCFNPLQRRLVQRRYGMDDHAMVCVVELNNHIMAP